MDNYEERNEKLLKQLNLIIKGDIRLIGDPQRPLILLNNKQILSAKVRYYKVSLFNNPFGGENLVNINLYKDVENHSEIVQDWINNSEHKEVFSIKLKNTELSYCGSNTVIAIGGAKEEPVFCLEGFKVYAKDKAENIVSLYPTYELFLE